MSVGDPAAMRQLPFGSPHLRSSSVARRQLKSTKERCKADEDRRCGRKFWTLYIFYWIKVFLKLPFAASFSVLYIYLYIYGEKNIVSVLVLRVDSDK